MAGDLVVERPQGLYCPPGDFYIDPWRPVARAVITHAHADHARAGHGQVLASAISEGLLRSRLGAGLNFQGLAYGETVTHKGVAISLHPAGHVLGSAQVRLAHGGRVWVASGDYFLSAHDEHNPTCAPFEPVRCHCFITESTFGLPVYRWAPQASVLAEINAWWRSNAAAGRPSLLMAYSLGKAQRLLAGVDASIGPIVVHGAMAPLNQAYRDAGVPLPPTHTLDALAGTTAARRAAAHAAPALPALAGALVLAPPAVQGSAWARRLGEFSDAFASGWMQLRGARRRQGVDRGFVLSDHADWPGLQRAIRATGAERVIVTHGEEAVMVRWLREQGLDAGSFRTEFGHEDGPPAATAPSAPPEPPAPPAPAADLPDHPARANPNPDPGRR
ncbi:ligase-associated DNA damage response exonuclease [Aquabacterium sp. OR-4]|nr:ligase-associated DNA damage response exonuclease [Aquabacterium sp. OR-4]MDT7835830.1 ligase-associated DNA damage response exonuclease [Aquabacterium sp. OR-4]